MTKIVIAEDDLTSMDILAYGLESLGYTVIRCSDGLRAFHVLQDNPDVKLLITDMVMPQLDGRELVELVRKDQKLKDIPVMVISGVVGPKSIRDILEVGATEFLGKPVNLDDLSDFMSRNVVTE
ncbi:MAG: response regulator [Deltaproteobacteria bacterium]|nr:response regulator [Deltaproteobacteria bacterium]